jgi:hypothetical protein
MSIYRTLLILSLTLILARCANQSMPTGGPIDKEPPELLKSEPAERETNYAKQTISLEFNEFIKEDKLKEQLIISPAITGEFITKVNKRNIQIILDEPLDNETTYTFNFGEGIKDITEGNAAKNLIITFSTGAYIDSLQITGNVFELMSGKVSRDWLVGLYNANDTITPINGKPRYFTKTDSLGNFKLQNLTRGEYLLYAFNDKNKNLSLNSIDEIHGFYPEVIYLNENKSGLKIPLVLNNLSELRITTKRNVGQYFHIRFSKPYKEITLNPVNSNRDIHYTHLRDENSIRFFNIYPNLGDDSVMVNVTAIDSIEQIINEIVAVKFPETSAKKENISVGIEPKSQGKILNGDSIQLVFDKPVNFIGIDSVQIRYDSIKTYIPKDLIRLNSNKTSIIFKPNLKDFDPGKEFTFYIPSRLIVSIEKDTIGEVAAVYSIKQEKDFGTIKGRILNTGDKEFWVQIVNLKDQVIAQKKNESNYSFNYLPPDSYKVRVLVDTNKDGIWSKGNALKRIPPEPVFFYIKPNPEEDEDPKVIRLRANWEVTDINIRFEN